MAVTLSLGREGSSSGEVASHAGRTEGDGVEGSWMAKDRRGNRGGPGDRVEPETLDARSTHDNGMANIR